MPGIAVVVFAVMVAVLLIARPTHDQILTSQPGGPRVVETAPAASQALVIPPAVGGSPEVIPAPGVIREPRGALAAPARYVPVRQGHGAGRSPSRPLVLTHRDFGQSP
jgi:hypothetical protein